MCVAVRLTVSIRAFQLSMECNVDGYRLPNRQKLAGHLLEEVHKEETEEMLVKQKSEAAKCGIEISTDGATKNRIPLVNCVVGTPSHKLVSEVRNTKGTSKTTEHLSKLTSDNIEKMPNEMKKNVYVVSTDGAECSVARDVAEKYGILDNLCPPHALNSLFKDWYNIEELKSVLDKAHDVVVFVLNHHKSKALYDERSNKALLLPADTRFTTRFIELARVLEVSDALKEMVADRRWEQWLKGKSCRHAGADVKRTVQDEEFWMAASEIKRATEPASSLLRLCDSNRGVMGKVYYRMFAIGEILRQDKDKFPTLGESAIDEMENAHAARWSYMHRDVHAAAHCLDPEYHSQSVHGNNEVMRGFRRACAVLFDNKRTRVKAMKELLYYKNSKGIFSQSETFEMAKGMSGAEWWELVGAETPEIQRMALILLSKSGSVSMNERTWKEYSWVHSKSRNRLKPTRAEKLVIVHSNLRMREKIESMSVERGHLAHVVEWCEDNELVDGESSGGDDEVLSDDDDNAILNLSEDGGEDVKGEEAKERGNVEEGKNDEKNSQDA